MGIFLFWNCFFDSIEHYVGRVSRNGVTRHSGGSFAMSGYGLRPNPTYGGSFAMSGYGLRPNPTYGGIDY